MKTTKLVLALIVAALILGTGPLAAQVVEQPWHVTGQVGVLSADNDRYIDDDEVWWGVGVGRFFGDHFSLDFEYDRFKADFLGDAAVNLPSVTAGSEWKLQNYGLMGRYHFTQAKVRPYLALGVGMMDHDNPMSSDYNLSLRAGAGLLGQVSKHFSIRMQYLYQQDRDGGSNPNKSSFNDHIFSLGINWDFGGKPPPPPPAKKAPPPPPPPPPNPDLDGDGVPNERDKCPNTRPGAVVDLDGCEVEAVIELEGVNFDFDKATLKPEAKVVLNEAAALLMKHDKVIVEIAGHTDSVGSESYNQGLSERRANAVKDYMTSKGLSATRMTAKGYGESRPIASNDTKEGRAENRRVEMIVVER